MGNRRKGIKASANAKKFYTTQAKIYAQISNQRKDYLQKTTTAIARKYSHIQIEDLNIRGMVANRKLSAAISDLGFYEFRRMLEYKQPIYGCKVELVDRWFPSSKTCSSCGCVKEKLSLSERVFRCSDCGFEIDRDLNAALNLSRFVPSASGKLKPVDKKVPSPLAEAGSKRNVVQ
jgi:putative transposase